MDFYILVEDSKGENNLKYEHGLSIYFEKDNKKYLMDTGQSDAYIKNAQALGIDLSKLDYVILSHGHYDHTGGLQHLPEECSAKLVAHPDYDLERYDGERYIGMPQKEINLETELTQIPLQLSENVFFLGEIPCERKPYGEAMQNGKRAVDRLYDDSALAVTGKDRVIVLCGCAHSGIENIAEYTKKLYDKKELILVGGFHMLAYKTEEITEAIDRLKKTGVSKVFCGHCTGKEACEKMILEIGGEKLVSGKKINV